MLDACGLFQRSNLFWRWRDFRVGFLRLLNNFLNARKRFRREGVRYRALALKTIKRSQLISDFFDLRMIGAEGFFPDLKSPLVALLSPRVIALCFTHTGQLIQAGCNLRVLRPPACFIDGQHPLKERSCLRISLLVAIKFRKVAEDSRNLRMLRT